MKINNSTQNPQSFGRIYMENSGITKELFNSLKDTPALKKFGENYDAYLSTGKFFSSRVKDRVQLFIRLTDIKPVKLITKFMDNIHKKNKMDYIILKTHATTEEELVKSIKNKPSDTLFNLYRK